MPSLPPLLILDACEGWIIPKELSLVAVSCADSVGLGRESACGRLWLSRWSVRVGPIAATCGVSGQTGLIPCEFFSPHGRSRKAHVGPVFTLEITGYVRPTFQEVQSGCVGGCVVRWIADSEYGPDGVGSEELAHWLIAMGSTFWGVAW